MAIGKVLIVDDNPAMSLFMSRALTREGYEVAVSPNGQHALDQLATYCPDVIVLDVMMPEMSGLDFLDAFSRVTDCSAPVVAISAVDQHQQALRAKGVAEFLSKPFDLDEFLVTVTKHIKFAPR